MGKASGPHGSHELRVHWGDEESDIKKMVQASGDEDQPQNMTAEAASANEPGRASQRQSVDRETSQVRCFITSGCSITHAPSCRLHLLLPSSSPSRTTTLEYLTTKHVPRGLVRALQQRLKEPAG